MCSASHKCGRVQAKVLLSCNEIDLKITMRRMEIESWYDINTITFCLLMDLGIRRTVTFAQKKKKKKVNGKWEMKAYNT